MMCIRSYLLTLRQKVPQSVCLLFLSVGLHFDSMLPGCLFRLQICSFNHSRIIKHPLLALISAFSFQMICIHLSTQTPMAQILRLTAVECSSRMHPPGNIQATGHWTKPTIISRTSRVTSCREVWCWGPQDLLKG